MRIVWLTFSALFLLGCFASLGYDFVRLVSSESTSNALRLAALWPPDFVDRLNAWAVLEDSTWGNTVRLGLRPLLLWPPVWLVCLVLALVFRLLARRSR